MGILSGLSALAGVILTAYGMSLQEDELARQRAEYRKQEGKEEERYQTKLAMTRAEIRRQEREARKAWKWQEEERDWGRVQQFRQSFQNMLDRQPMFAQNLINVIGSRR
jgi:ribosomal protein S4